MRRIVQSLAFKITSLIVFGECLGVIIFMMVHSSTHATDELQAQTIGGALLLSTFSILLALLAVRIILRARTAELVAAQTALQQREALYREIVNLAQDVIIHVRTDTSLSYVSPSIEAVLGYPPEQYQSDPTSVARTLHPSSTAVFEAFWAAYHRDDRFSEENLTVAWFTRAGREVWLEHRITNLRDAAGKVIGFQSIGRDITARRDAELALRAERDLLNATLATSVQGIMVLNPQGQIIFANQRAEAVLGLTRDSLTKRTYNAPEWRATALDGGPWPDEAQPFQRVLTTGAPVFDVQHAIITSDGRRLLLSINGAPIKDSAGQITSIVFSVADITQQKQAEADLRTSEERLRALVHDIGVGVTLHDANGAIVMANPAACAIFDYTEAELIKKHNHGHDWHPIDEFGQPLPAVNRPVRRARMTGEPVHNQVLGTHRHRTDERIWLLMSAAPQFAPSGELRSIVCSFSDVTEQRQLEARLRQAQKLEAVGRLAGGVAHDFNNLLTVISGTCDLVLLNDSLQGDVRLDVEQIRQASRRAADLTRQLLVFSRQQVLQLQDLNLNDALTAAERLLRRLIGEDVQIVTRLAPTLWPVRADPTQMEQVVLNLALNGRDAMPQGGTLTFITANVLVPSAGALVERLPAPGAYVRLTVQDTGSGISPELQPYVFEPFFTTKDSGRGTGLGLATVHGIVTQSGGAIWFTSAAGAGTCFEIYLPRAQAADGAPFAEPTALLQAPLGGRETVLVVEDEQPVRTLVARVLQRQGYQVLTAADGVAALGVLAAHRGPIHLLLTDMVMPGGMSGEQLAVEVRALYPQIRTLLMSGYANNLTGIVGTVATADAFLQKPFEIEQLVRKVRELLDALEPNHAARSRTG